jgi:cellulose synthase/poly-beta-1,6-N-acetylglucosamine synthase-like glycosyltransferase
VRVLIVLHSIAALLLAVYALHQVALLVLHIRARRSPQAPLVRLPDDALPGVTAQLPLYNERLIAARAIDALLALDYPRDRLHIQVLDDSTDDTARISRERVFAARARGVHIDWIHRGARDGYKAGALANGFRAGTQPFVAIFDADFVPAPDFLRRVFAQQPFDHPDVGYAQTRWDYLNRDESGVTRGQALVLDVHFVIEQHARHSAGLPMAFNGSGGVWRRACIEDAGGWQADTLTEDLDLSYRARLRGWHGVYLSKQGAPGELPHSVLSYKRQQARWARGSLQTVRKIAPALLRSRETPLHKLAGLLHLSGYCIHPLILFMSISTPLLLLNALNGPTPPGWVNIASTLGAAPILSMAVASAVRGRGWRQFLADLPHALMLGIGVSFSNTRALLQALFVRETGEFVRTPKAQTEQPRAYRIKPDWTMWIELALTVYTVAVIITAVWLNSPWAAAPILLYAFGFGQIWLAQVRALVDARRAQRGA